MKVFAGDILHDVRQPGVHLVVDSVVFSPSGSFAEVIARPASGGTYGKPQRISSVLIFEAHERPASGFRLEAKSSAHATAANEAMASKLESIISGYRINSDDADWLRALAKT